MKHRISKTALAAYAKWAADTRSLTVTITDGGTDGRGFIWDINLPPEIPDYGRIAAWLKQPGGRSRRINAWVTRGNSVVGRNSRAVLLDVYPRLGDTVTLRW